MKKILVLFKTHLDMGFTRLARDVARLYREVYIPQAIRVGNELMDRGIPEGFVWTTGSWLIDDYLAHASAEEQKRMEQAIKRGIIRWHALPCTLHSEAADAELFKYGLSLSKKLDERFGLCTTGAKMTDVPGHTRAIVPLLAQAGVTLLHLGVNPASMPPEVPDLFRWQSPDGETVTVMYSKGDYGDFACLPGTDTGVLFAHTGDNLGPQSPEEIIAVYDELHTRYPEAEIRAADLTMLAHEVEKIADQLPIVTSEIGDTWIHGVGSAPDKVRAYRTLLRLAKDWPEAAREPLYRELILVPEHTWGLDNKTWLRDMDNYSRADVAKRRGAENYRVMEESWQEQRDYLTRGVQALSEPYRQMAQQALRACDDMSISGDWQETDERRLKLGDWTFEVDETGALTNLTRGGAAVFGGVGHIGRFCYEHFSSKEVEAFRSRYSRLMNVEWAIQDFGKPGMERLQERYQAHWPALKRVLTDGHDGVLIELHMDDFAVERYACPPSISLEVRSQADGLLFTLRWADKAAMRIPEGLWVSCCPDCELWTIEKLGQWIDPTDVASCGARENHCIHRARFERMELECLDAPLVSVGKPSLFRFENQLPTRRDGLWINLFNNMWNTNFPLWNEGDAVFRWKITQNATRA